MHSVHYTTLENNPPPHEDPPLIPPRSILVSRAIMTLDAHQIKVWLAIKFMQKTAIPDRDGLWCMLTQDAIAHISGYSARHWVGEVIKSLILAGHLEAIRVPNVRSYAYRTKEGRYGC